MDIESIVYFVVVKSRVCDLFQKHLFFIMLVESMVRECLKWGELSLSVNFRF